MPAGKTPFEQFSILVYLKKMYLLFNLTTLIGLMS